MANLTTNQLQEIFNSLTIEQADTLKESFLIAFKQHQYDTYLEAELFDFKLQDLKCPVCGCAHVAKHGKDQFGHQRYRCLNRECKRKTFSLKTNTLMYYSKSTKAQWLTFFECLFHGDSIKTTINKVGVCENTVLMWRHKTMYLLYKMLDHGKLVGLVEMDETHFDRLHQGKKGMEKPTKKKRGVSDDKVNVACAIDETGNFIAVVKEYGRITSKALLEVFDGIVGASNKVISDSLRSYHKVQKELNYDWVKIPSGKKSYKGYTLDKINELHGNIKQFLSKYRGVSELYLQGYISLYETLIRYPRYYQEKSFRALVKRVLITPMIYRCYDFDEATFLYD